MYLCENIQKFGKIMNFSEDKYVPKTTNLAVFYQKLKIMDFCKKSQANQFQAFSKSTDLRNAH